MKHVSAYLLCVLGGNAAPTEADVKKILASVGAKCDDTCLAKVCAELKGKNVEELIEAGAKKLATVSMGGGGGAAPAAAAAAPAAGGKAAAPAKKDEPEEEEDMGFSLFD
ncbi:ribosomal acidic phosphoprotein P2 [Baffinella frigidus]|nr:ribosomal acidic phosphoprotein P2 [Cryptophyta sp. CCMP2293]|mmetsp:Transcript_30044/g.71514  ORF Transcript_30044/g.71514 Transcript_30044/m.71514 type:complete len:110 (+) Transcript_30044:103-432(+)